MTSSWELEFGDVTGLQGLLDSGPSWSVVVEDLPVGFGDLRFIPDTISVIRGRCNGQTCLLSQAEPRSLVTSESSPCPCDRWCESSDSCLIDGAYSDAHSDASPVPRRQVHFAPYIEVFEYSESEVPANYVVTHRLEITIDDVPLSPSLPDDKDFHQGAFWDFWQRCWLWHGLPSGEVGSSALDAGSDKSPAMCTHCWPDLPCLQCRPETNPPPVLIANPVDDANDFGIDLDEEQDQGNDIGVSFFRWQDLAGVVDVMPLTLADGIPFITFGLRNFPLGRRDFVSPDLSPSRLRDIIWQLWQDEVHQFEDVSIHFVRPQPTDELACHGVIVLIVEIINDDMPDGVSPVLAITCDRTDRLLDTPQAIYVPQAADNDELTAHFGMAHLCSPAGFRQCKVYAANNLVGARQAQIPAGVLIKLVISAKLQLFARAMDWFPDLERFAAMVRRNVRTGIQVHALELHLPHRASITLQFRIADIFQNQALKSQIVQSCQVDAPVVFPLAGDQLGLANPTLGSHFHVMVIPGGGPIALMFATVTQLVGQDGTILRSSNQVVRREDYLTLHDLHRHLCNQFLLDPTLAFHFECNGQTVTTIQTVSFASVVVHVLQQIGHGDSPSNQGATDADMSAPNELSDSSVGTDSLSLLQTRAVRGRSILLMQHDQPLLKVDVLPDVEDVERCDIASRIPNRFALPQGWLDRRPYCLADICHDVEILVDSCRPTGAVDVLCECLHHDGLVLVPQCLCVLRVLKTCTWDDIVGQLIQQRQVLPSEIDSISVDKCPVFQDSVVALDDGAHCVVILSTPLSDGFGGFATIESRSPIALTHGITTYIHEFPHLPSRYDVVGPHEPERFLAMLQSRTLEQQPVCMHRVKWDPNDLEPCRNLFLLDVSSQGVPDESMLFVLRLHDGKQAWQICRLSPDHLLAGIANRFPDALKFLTLADGIDVQLHNVSAQPGTCIFCDSDAKASCGVDFPFTKGMQLLLDWLSTPQACPQPDSLVESSENGDAPCPCDRWCADPASVDHLPPVQCSTEPSKKPSAVPISLAAAIPDSCQVNAPPKVTIPLIQSGAFGPKVANLNVKLCPDLPDGMRVHRSTAIEFLKKTTCPSAWEIPHRHELYIDGSATGDHCSWALVHVHRWSDGSRHFVGLLAGCVPSDPEDSEWLGAQQLDNISAELTAMCVAYAYAISLQVPCCICPDLRFGHDLVRRQVTNKTNSGLAKLCTALGREQYIPIEEIRAHKGDPYNELADSVAKWAGRQGISLGSFDYAPLHDMAAHPIDLEWAWLFQMCPSLQMTLPYVDYRGQLHVTPALGQLDLPQTVAPAPKLEPSWSFSLNVATANVQSAREKSTGTGSRCHALTKRFDQQWYQHSIDIVGIQEARTPQGQDVSQHYAIYCSGVDVSQGSAHFGCEIWLRKDAIIATTDQGDELKLGTCRVVVHAADPRRLVLIISHGTFQMVVASLHAPCHSQHTSFEDLNAWWGTTTSIFTKLPMDRCVICIDANAPLGCVALPLTGDCGAETENAQSDLFRQFLELHQMTVPCTFPDCHVGASGTWKHPKGMVCRRDYVLLSLQLQPWATKSFIVEDFDRARSHVDHLPSVLCLRGWLRSMVTPRKFHWDPDKLRDPAICEQFRHALASLPLPTWDVTADDHCRLWEEQLLNVAAQFFTKTHSPGRTKPRPALSASTLALIQFKRHVLSLARHSGGPLYDDYKMVLRDVEKQVRTQVAADQRAWYDDLVGRVQASGELHDSAHMFKLLRRLGSRKYKAPRRPLPMLQKDDASYTTSVSEMQEVFRSQFAALEGGIQKSYDELAADHHCHELLPAAQVDVGMLISPWDIAQAIAKMKRGKVPGKNGITTEILKRAGDVAATQMVPLLMKCVMHQFEPLSWKGGTLVPLFKGKGRVDSPTSYRSIFISDTTCKTFHSCLRTRLLRTWEKAMCTLQFGGRAGYGTDVAHHYAHAFLSWSRHTTTPAALIFLDLTAAFYSVLRQGLFQHEICDQHLCYAFTSLGIAPEDLHEVINTVTSEAAVEGVSMHCDLVLKGLFEATHFSMDGVAGITHTSKGTRPGDPIADLLFNMAMRLIQRSVQRKLDEHHLQDLAQRPHGDHLFAVPALPPQGYAMRPWPMLMMS